MSPISTSGASIAKGLFALVWLAGGYARNWRKVLPRPWFWPAVAMLALNALGMLWTADTARGLVVLSKLDWIFFAVAGAMLPWERRRFILVARLFLAGLAVNALIGALQWFHLFPWRPADPIVGPIGYADHIFLSMALANAIFWLAYDFKNETALPRPLSAALATLFFIQLVVTGGRAGQVAFVFLFPTALYMLYSGRWRRWMMGMAALAFIGLALSPMVHDRVRSGVDDLRQYINGKDETSLGLRFVFWKGALEMAAEHPVLGVGTGDYGVEMVRLEQKRAIPRLPGFDFVHPHNSYLAYLADLGLPGLFVLLWFLWAATREAWRWRGQPEAWFKLCYMAIFLIGSFTDTLIWGFDNAIALGIITAIPVLAQGA